MKNKRIILIGAGNVATHVASALLKEGFNLCQIYSRTAQTAHELSIKTGITYTTEPLAVYPDGDIYIMSVSDMALLPVFKSLKINPEAVVLHTSGSIPMDVFKPFMQNYGVLYPLQTFSKKRSLNFREVPLCIEADNKSTLQLLNKMACELSDHVYEINTVQRKGLHLAAVYANNFVNHLYALSNNILRERGLDFAMLRPLIYETADKVMTLMPEEAQTGPACRNDTNVINMHRAAVKNNLNLLSVYNLLSESIRHYELSEKSKEEGNQLSLNL